MNSSHNTTTDPPQAAPMSLDEVLSREWLTCALSKVNPDSSVQAVTVVETLRTVATKVRFRVEWSGGNPRAPTDFCVKSGFGPVSDGHRKAGVLETEANFYRELAHSIPVRTPVSVYTGIDPTSRQAVVVMHDLVSTGHRFLTALEPYSVDQAAGTLDQLALLHAYDWDSKQLDRYSWLSAGMVHHFAQTTPPVADLQSLLDGDRGRELPQEIRDAGRLRRAIGLLSEQLAQDSACLVHGDAHAGNVFETSNGDPGFVDWQLLHRGSWALDVAYHVGAALDVAERERSERDLLTHYLDRLSFHGVHPPPWDEAWVSYRRALFYGYYLWSITRQVAEPITITFATRLGLAVAANQSLDIIEEAV